jgi:hypothetical protein
MTKQHHPAYRGPWSTVRKTILERDNHQCQIRAPKCTGTANHVDHIIPVLKGGAWWDPDNLRASCAHCNNQRVDRKQETRWETAPTKITLIIGPPGAGKTTYVNTHAQPGDLIIDYDQIADALGGSLQSGAQNSRAGTKRVDGIGHEAGHLHEATMAARNAILRTLKQGKVNVPRAWIISSNPKAEVMFPFHKVVTVDAGKQETLRRAAQAGRPASWSRLIEDWYRVRSGADNGSVNSRKW